MKKKSVQSTSHYWNGFIRVLAWISKVLGSRVGDGCLIILGIYSIAGLNTNYMLSLELLTYLNNYGICTLNLVHNTGEGTATNSYWLTADDLELEGRMAYFHT